MSTATQPRKQLTVGQKAAIGAGIGLAVFIVVLEKRRVENIVKGFALLVEETGQQAFDDGVESGMQLAKKLLAPTPLKEIHDSFQK